MVTIDEITVLINIALEAKPVSACAAIHGDTVSVTDIISAVNNALDGCRARLFAGNPVEADDRSSL